MGGHDVSLAWRERRYAHYYLHRPWRFDRLHGLGGGHGFA